MEAYRNENAAKEFASRAFVSGLITEAEGDHIEQGRQVWREYVEVGA